MQRLTKYTIVVAILFVSTMFQSCSDFLNREPYSTIKLDKFYQDENQANLALTGIYSIIGSDYTYGYYLSSRFTCGTDAMVFSRNYSTWNVALNTANNSTKEIEDTYRTLYEGVNLANTFIDKVNASTTIDDAAKLRLTAQARFLRAFFYFDLVRWFGDVPMRTKPVLSGSTEDTSIKKSKVLDIYKDLIIPDLEFAGEHTYSKGDTDYEVGRITKSAAWGILQRVYLTIAGVKNDTERGNYPDFDKTACYGKVLEFGKKVQSAARYSLIPEYKDIFLNEIKGSVNDQEVMFEVQFTNMRSSGRNEHGRNGNINGIQCSLAGLTDPYAYAYSYAGLSLVYDYEESTGDANDDKRYLWNIAPFKVGFNNVLDTTYVVDDAGQPVLDANGFKQIDHVLFTTKKVAGFTYIGNNHTRYPGKFRRISFDEMENGVYRTERLKAQLPSGKNKTIYTCYKQMPSTEYLIGNDGEDYAYVLNDDGSEKRLSPHFYLVAEGKVWKQLANSSLPLKKLESGEIDKNYTGINFPILRYADVLLMMAEAHIQLGQLNDAVPFVNQIRRRAGLPNLTNDIIADQTRFFNELVDERNRELCYEGVRRHDLVRWGLFGSKLQDLNSLMKAEPISKGQSWMLRSGENYSVDNDILPTPLKETNINIGL